VIHFFTLSKLQRTVKIFIMHNFLKFSNEFCTDRFIYVSSTFHSLATKSGKGGREKLFKNKIPQVLG